MFIAVATAVVQAQRIAMPSGMNRGTLASMTSSEISVRASRDAIYFCSYDARTYVERSNSRIAVMDLASGESVEVLADRKPGSSQCYARIIQSVPRHPAVPIDFGARAPVPLGELTFSGLVTHRDGYALTLRLKSGVKEIRVGRNTRYIGDGLPLDLDSLPINTYVFVRAGRDAWGQIEAYRVIWGSIIEVTQ